jgi:DNA-binding transcriptional LysR family regulator
MDVKDLRYFVAVYEEGGFARAGILLETVQSNVSARIRRLEAALGVQLFERHRRGVVATDKGEKLYRHAKRVIALLEETPEAVRGKEAA